MKVLYGGGVLAASGSIGGQTASHNRFGNYIRARTTPVNPKTNRQSAVRACVAWLADAWRTVLTQAQRNGWEVYAANIVRTDSLGSQMHLTGFNMYIRCNTAAVTSGLAHQVTAPVIQTLGSQDPTVVCTADEAAQQISVVFADGVPWTDTDLGLLSVQMSLPHPVGRNYIGGPYRMAGFIQGDTAVPITSPQVMAVPFPVLEDQVVKCQLRIREADGRLSDPWFHQSSVTA